MKIEEPARPRAATGPARGRASLLVTNSIYRGGVMVPTSWYLLLAAILFSIGAGGVLLRRNALVILMCVELMMNSVNLTFVAFARELSSMTGQIFVFMTITVAAVEAAVGLAILVELYRHVKSVNIDDFNALKG
jgi:NADH-quinone oxidoreductase subunit K